MAFRSDSAFGGNYLLKLSIEDSGGLLPQGAPSEILRETVYALLLWRRMCVRCAVGSGAVVLLDNEVLADGALVSLLHAIDYDHIRPRNQPPPVDLGCATCPLAPPRPPLETDLTWTDLTLNARLNSRMPLSDYVQVDPHDPDAQRLCKAPIGKVPEELAGLRRALSCAGDGKATPLPLKLRALNGVPPECDETDHSVIGCETNGSLVELNAGNFTFVTHDGSKSVFGEGHDRVDLQVLLIHELGHWAGIVGHLKTPNNIMNEYVNYAKCIDNAVVDSLSKVTAPGGSIKPLALRFDRGAQRR